MLLKSILNRVQLHPGFVYGSIKWQERKKRPILQIEIRPRKNRRPVCSVCGIPGPGYDTLPVRSFEFVPLWGIAVFFLYAAASRVSALRRQSGADPLGRRERIISLPPTPGFLPNGPSAYHGRNAPLHLIPAGTTSSVPSKWLWLGVLPTATSTTSQPSASMKSAGKKQ